MDGRTASPALSLLSSVSTSLLETLDEHDTMPSVDGGISLHAAKSVQTRGSSGTGSLHRRLATARIDHRPARGYHTWTDNGALYGRLRKQCRFRRLLISAIFIPLSCSKYIHKH